VLYSAMHGMIHMCNPFATYLLIARDPKLQQRNLVNMLSRLLGWNATKSLSVRGKLRSVFSM